jgi:hypothetical protein
MVSCFASLFAAGIFIFLPLSFSKAGKSSNWPRKKSALLYFSCLGAGFIILEWIFIQIFMKLIGYPLYTYSTVVFVLLIAAGAGSFFSMKWGITPTNRWTWPFIGILITGSLLLTIHSYVFDIFLASTLLIRIIVAVLLLIPLGFFLGMPFPLGILAIEKQPAGSIAWAWGLNGLFTVVGGLLSLILSILIGFQGTILVALAIYFLAFLIFARISSC